MHRPISSSAAHRPRSKAAATGKYAVRLAALLVALAAVVACSPSPAGSETTPVGAASPTPEQRTGQQIFASTCSACHGVGGEGQPNWHIPKADGILPAPPLNGDGHTWHHPDGWLYQVVSQGGRIQEGPSVPNFRSGMPAFGDTLTHQEIIDVLTYVKSLWEDKMSRSGLIIKEAQAFVSEADPFPVSGN